ncbi:hypothetical protein CFC21_019991 [Triticum aestivum]|uniref:F-box domain-containing protein n=2 Tax=Triticum aestivum TaxID=4565 RepID=A0A3B6B7J5_WHEAT|nr:hypothetical protein CFC21_019991 [Triticum aestivum]
MRGQPAPPRECADTTREILLKLPTRDVTRCCCVSRLWRDVVADPTFRRLHAEAEAEADHVAAAPEALLVTETREHGRSDEASFSCISSSKPASMPHSIVIPSGYGLSNVCNGLLCFAHNTAPMAPVLICNPVTGETATLPKPPPRWHKNDPTEYHHIALGFSPSTKEYKLFRFSVSSNSDYETVIQQSVCTLGGGRDRWRRQSYISMCPLLHNSPPVLVDGKLYLMTSGRGHQQPRNRNSSEMLVVDVATEEYHMHHLPVEDKGYYPDFDPQVKAFEMSGRLCLAVDIYHPHRKLQFWVFSPPAQYQRGECDNKKLCWDLRHNFYTDGNRCSTLTSVCFDDGEKMLCFRRGDILFKHDTRGCSLELSPEADCEQCHQRLELPPTPSNCKWNVLGGYRPSLLSPLTLATPLSLSYAEAERQQFKHKLLLTLRRHE